ncbi:MAG: TadE/TadG family type IV pilus assembly protein [Terracidiphilus sp.]
MKLRGASLLRRMLRNGRGCGESHSIRSRILAFLRSDSDGGAIVETALIMPIYLLVLTGMLSTVMALYTYQQLDLATFTAAENVGISRGTIVGDDPCQVVVSSVTTGLNGYNTANITYTLWITQNISGTVTRPSWTGQGSSFSCAGTVDGDGAFALTLAQGQPLTLQLSYPYNWLPIWMSQKSGVFTTIETVYVN